MAHLLQCGSLGREQVNPGNLRAGSPEFPLRTRAKDLHRDGRVVESAPFTGRLDSDANVTTARRIRSALFASLLAVGLSQTRCGPPSSFCGRRPISGSDAGFWGYTGAPTGVGLNVPAPTFNCEKGVPKRVDAEVKDPTGDAVPFEVVFVPGPEDSPEKGVASITFTPTRSGWHDVSANFEPGWGNAQVVGFVFLARQGSSVELPVPPAGTCATLARTSSGLWVCDQGVLLARQDGGMALPGGRLKVAGDRVWAYAATHLDGGTHVPSVARFDTADGGLTLTHQLSLGAFAGSTDQVIATPDSLFVIPNGGTQDGLLLRYAPDGTGALTSSVVGSPADAGLSFDAKLLLQEGDAVFVARQLSAVGGQAPDFQVCGFDVVTPANAPTCATYHGLLVGTGSGGVFSYAERDKVLRLFSPQGRALLPRSNLTLPTGMRRSLLAGADATDYSLAPVFESSEVSLGMPDNVRITPRFTPGDGLTLELLRFGSATPQGAAGVYSWGLDQSATPPRLRVFARDP